MGCGEEFQGFYGYADEFPARDGDAAVPEHAGKIVDAFSRAAGCVQAADSLSARRKMRFKVAFQKTQLTGVAVESASMAPWQEMLEQEAHAERFIAAKAFQQVRRVG